MLTLSEDLPPSESRQWYREALQACESSVIQIKAYWALAELAELKPIHRQARWFEKKNYRGLRSSSLGLFIE